MLTKILCWRSSAYLEFGHFRDLIIKLNQVAILWIDCVVIPRWDSVCASAVEYWCWATAIVCCCAYEATLLRCRKRHTCNCSSLVHKVPKKYRAVLKIKLKIAEVTSINNK